MSSYEEKKAYFSSFLTIYGRKAVEEALKENLDIRFLHLADSNKPARILQDIESLANTRNIPIKYHSKQELSRISRNGKQDQGIAADIHCPHHQSIEDYLGQLNTTGSPQAEAGDAYIALDNITNPQNLGMIIRSACAGNIRGIILARKGNTQIGPLVIKASAGTVFKAPILTCDSLLPALKALRKTGHSICILSAQASTSLFEHRAQSPTIYVLGNESDGVSKEVANLSDQQLCIPMNNAVESLNVAVTAALIAFLRPKTG